MAELQIPDKWRDAFAWVEKTVGGRLVEIDAQHRWRPAWYLEVEKEGERLPLYWRGARTEWGADIEPLEREGKIMEVLEAHGVRVPHVFGLHLDPPGLLMERRPGAPPNVHAAASPADGEAIIDEYLGELAKIHAIPVSEFEKVGLRAKASAEESCLGETPAMEEGYRAAKSEPDPLIEFLLKWVRRNVPRDRERQTLVLCDSGQFLWEGRSVTALLDFELAYIGDPAADLAGLRPLQVAQGLGEIARAQ
ncbi:MAG: phosphotransferase, partial [Planctomycetota bacterium]